MSAAGDSGEGTVRQAAGVAEIVEIVATWGAAWDPGVRDGWRAASSVAEAVLGERVAAVAQRARVAWLFLDDRECREVLEALLPPGDGRDAWPDGRAGRLDRAERLLEEAAGRVERHLERAREAGILEPGEEAAVRQALAGEVPEAAWGILPRLARVEEEARARREVAAVGELLARLEEATSRLASALEGRRDERLLLLVGTARRLAAALREEVEAGRRPAPGLAATLRTWSDLLTHLAREPVPESGAALPAARELRERIVARAWALEEEVRRLPSAAGGDLAGRVASLAARIEALPADAGVGDLIEPLVELGALEEKVHRETRARRARDERLLAELEQEVLEALPVLPPPTVLEARRLLDAGRTVVVLGETFFDPGLRGRLEEIRARVREARAEGARLQRRLAERERRRLLALLGDLRRLPGRAHDRGLAALARRIEKAPPEALPGLRRQVDATWDRLAGRFRFEAARAVRRARRVAARRPASGNCAPGALEGLARDLEAALVAGEEIPVLVELREELERELRACRRPVGRLVAVAVAAILVLAAAVGGGWWWWHAGGTRVPRVTLELQDGDSEADVTIYRIDGGNMEEVARLRLDGKAPATVRLEPGRYALVSGDRYAGTFRVPADAPVRVPPASPEEQGDAAGAGNE